MTREPLHYWRRRHGFTLGTFVHNAKLKRIYNPWRDVLQRPFGDSPLLARIGRRNGMSMNAAIGAVCLEHMK